MKGHISIQFIILDP